MRFINKPILAVVPFILALTVLAGCGQPYSFPFDAGSGRSQFTLGSVSVTGRADPFSDGLSVVTGDVNGRAIEEMRDDQSAGIFSLSGEETLYAYNVHEKASPASLTKIMTALVALENMSADTMLTASEDIIVEESGAVSLGIDKGDRMTLDQALHFLLMESDNDVAILVAENVAGSVETFTGLMNQESMKLGATNCTFLNPNGLTEKGHEVTAYDLYLIMRKAVEYSTFVDIIGCASYSTQYTKGDGSTVEKEIISTNGYITGEYSAPDSVTVLGGKTGTTAAAGHCLMLYVKDSKGTPYAVIVMHAGYKEELYAQMDKVLALLEPGDEAAG
ncbi:MAG: serine hydrolase [Lachnospiraceae bacterium]|nr:serine hydrolase [Lachnospiraceae bacterium]